MPLLELAAASTLLGSHHLGAAVRVRALGAKPPAWRINWSRHASLHRHVA